MDQPFISSAGIVEAADLWVLLGEGLEWFWTAELRTKLGVVTGVYVTGMVAGILLAVMMT